jgi:hypothetical protein
MEGLPAPMRLAKHLGGNKSRRSAGAAPGAASPSQGLRSPAKAAEPHDREVRQLSTYRAADYSASVRQDVPVNTPFEPINGSGQQQGRARQCATFVAYMRNDTETNDPVVNVPSSPTELRSKSTETGVVEQARQPTSRNLDRRIRTLLSAGESSDGVLKILGSQGCSLADVERVRGKH